MKKIFTILFLLVKFSIYAQDLFTPRPNGYKLKWVTNYIEAYRCVDAYSIDTAAPKIWNHKFWFYKVGEITQGGIEYVVIFIPEDNIGVAYAAASWSSGGRIFSEVSKNEYNIFIAIKKTDYDKSVIDHYPKFTNGLVWTALTIPLKIRPAINGRSSSLYNSNFNAGTFIGWRLGFLNDVVGTTVGGFGGFSSLEQTSSVNSSIEGNTNQNMFAASYGGGIIIDITRKFQLGGIIGWDYGYGDISKTYVYQNKHWFALSLNFAFLDTSKPVISQ